MDVVGADREVATELTLQPEGNLIRERKHAIWMVERRPAISYRRARRKHRRDLRLRFLAQHRPVREKWIGRPPTLDGARVMLLSGNRRLNDVVDGVSTTKIAFPLKEQGEQGHIVLIEDDDSIIAFGSVNSI